MRRVKGKVVTKYVGYLGKSPGSKVELTGKDIFPYVERLLDVEIPDSDIRYHEKVNPTYSPSSCFL